ncbi:MAG TPA: CHAT domain-containing protein, partial [Allosphingosinicella sp.]|nr:CHAT domain-containing protein [Allosphingosinicella sp.]
SALAELPQLPGSARELAVVARSFDAGKSTLLTGRDADEAGLKARDLSRYSVILFSTHGLVSGELEGVAEPALVLSPPSAAGNDGLLTASEIALLRLSADWVILSACNTAAGGSGGSAAYSGLAQAFRFAGANALLVSHWPVRDDIASFLTIEAVRASQRGMRKDKALQHALRKLVSSRTIAKAAEPFAWAPFVLVAP